MQSQSTKNISSAHLLNQISTAVLGVDFEGNVVFWNQGAARLYRRSSAEMLGQPLACAYTYEFVNGENEEFAFSRIRSIGCWSGENLHATHDGRELLVESDVTFLRNDDGEEIGYLAVIRDITAKRGGELKRLHQARRAEHEARDREAKLNLAMQAAQMGAWDLNCKAGNLHWSFGHFALFGMEPSEFDGKLETGLDRLHPEDRDRIRRELETALAQRLPKIDQDFRVVWPDGSIHWVTSRARIEYSPQGEPLRILGVNWDFSDRKLAADLLITSEDKFRTSIETVPQPFAMFSSIRDHSGKIVDFHVEYANAAGLADIGLPAEQYIGRNVCEVIPAHRESGLLAAYVGAVESGTPFHADEFRFCGEFEGELVERWYEVHASKWEDGLVVAWQNVTEQHNAAQIAAEQEAKLRESEQKLRVLSENIPQLIWTTDGAGYATYYNQRWYEYTGQTHEQAVGLGWQDALHPDDRARVAEHWQAAIRGNGLYDVEYRLRRQDGVYRWFMARGQPIFGADGTITHWFGTSTDISERCHIEQELRDSRERLMMAMQAGNSGTFEWNVKNHVNRWAPMLETLHGFEVGTFPATFEAWRDCLLPEDRSQAEAAVAESLRTGRLAAQWRIRRKNNGAVRWISAHGRVFFDADGKPERMLGLNVDITERKQDEQRIRQSEARYRSLVEASSQLVWTVPGSGFVDHEVPEWQSFTGQSVQDIMGWGWSEAIHPEDRQSTLQAWQSALATKTACSLEHRIRRKDGVYRHMQLKAVPVMDSDGNVIEWVGMHTDITEQQRSEEALRRAEKLAVAGRLAMSISHEINNPLEAVINTMYLVASDPTLNQETRKYVEMGQQELRRVAHLVSQTLSYARNSSRSGDVNMREIVESALTLFQSRLLRANVVIQRDYGEITTLHGSDDAFRQVVVNLISNAYDAMRTGGQLRIRVGGGTSWRSPHRAGVRITIADTGVGMSGDVRHRLFEPFFTTKAATGTGLGLWVCSEIVRQHNGEISVRSSDRPGRSGTVFSIFLPQVALGESATSAVA